MRSLQNATDRDLARSQADFGLALFERFGNPGENLCFSPYGLFIVLAMTCAGARGETGMQMRQALRLKQSVGELQQSFAAIQAAIARVESEAVVLKAAAALWPYSETTFLPEFLTLNTEVFNTVLTAVDYRRPEEARKKINAWAEVQTGHKISGLIPQGVLDDLTRLVLTQAVYFKGKWEKEFSPHRTVTQPFTLDSGRVIETPMMSQTGPFGYVETARFQLLELPYVGLELSLLILLPARSERTADIINGLSGGKLETLVSGMGQTEVRVTLPKFRIAWGAALNEYLIQLGIEDAFSIRKADFSGMTAEKPGLYIDRVFHRAAIEVNEEGSEAAAASAVVMKLRSAGPAVVEFRADHPFVFFTRERSTGTLLFAGWLADPAG